MRLFRVTGEWMDHEVVSPEGKSYTHYLPPQEERVVHITQGEEGPGLYVGEYFLPISKALAEPFLEENPPEWLPLFAANLNEGNPCRLFQAAKDELEQARSGRYYGTALVHICLPHVKDVPVRYFSSTYDELEIPYRSCPRVERKYHDFSQAVGVRIIVDSDEEKLLELLPGASFRLHRDEHQLAWKDSPVLVVAWNGKVPRVFRPTKFKEDRRHSRPPRRRREVSVRASPAYPAA